MPNIVQNAVGTQRQFTKQPVATYQKSLRNITVNNGLVNTGAGERLHQALMGLGGALMNYAVGEEERKRANVVRVNRIISSMSDEDMKTLKGMDLLNKYGEHQLANNPYAVAAIEQARGKYFSDKFNQQYSILQAQEPVKTEAEERERYMSEKKKFLEENEGASYNLEGFYNGFWASNLQDVSNISNQKTAEISKSMKGLSLGGIAADFYKLANDYSLDEKPDALVLKDSAQAILNDARLQGMQDNDKAELLHGFLVNVAQLTGSRDLVEQLGNLIIGTNDDGSNMLYSQKRPMDDVVKMADQAQMAKPNDYSLKVLNDFAKCDTQEQLDEKFNALPKVAQNRFRDVYAKATLDMTQRAKIAEQKALTKQSQNIAQGQSFSALEADFARYSNNKTSAANVSALGAKQADVDAWAQGKFQEIAEMPMGEARDRALANLFYYPLNTNIRKSIANMFERSLDTMSPEQMMSDGSATGVAQAMSLMDASPAQFRRAFGPEVTNKIHAIKAMQDLMANSSDGASAAYKLFCNGRDRYNDPDIKEAVDQKVKDLFEANGVNLKDVKTGEERGFAYDDPELLVADKWAFKYVLAADQQMDTDKAMHNIDPYIQKNFVSYNGRIIPKVFFSAATDTAPGIFTTYGETDPYKIVKDYMENTIATAPDGYNESNLSFSYDNDAQTIVLRSSDWMTGNGFSHTWTIDKWYKDINEWYAKSRVEQMNADKEAEETTVNDDTDNEEEAPANSVAWWQEDYDGPID